MKNERNRKKSQGGRPLASTAATRDEERVSRRVSRPRGRFARSGSKWSQEVEVEEEEEEKAAEEEAAAAAGDSAAFTAIDSSPRT